LDQSAARTFGAPPARPERDPRRLPAIFWCHLRLATRFARRRDLPKSYDVEKAVANEASSLAALYRDISAYPEPDRTDLKNAIREYNRSTVEDAWLLQRPGIDPR